MPDSTRCPRCHTRNQCAATTATPSDCWCFAQRPNSKALEALALDPALGCLCPACLAECCLEDEPPCA